MTLTLVYGPANAGKAGRVLAAYRDRLAREPLLVVPTLRDVERAELELAGAGVVFGARVVRPSRLFERLAERVGLPRAVYASPLQRRLLLEQAVAGAPLRVLRRSAAHAGFSRSAGRFGAELEQLGVGPEALEEALGLWVEGGAGADYAGEVAAVYRAYRRGLERAGLVTPELHARNAVDALRREPFRWGGAPVLLHGFDDFTPLELDLVEALAGPAEADVWVSLPYERGRACFRAVAESFERLAARADRLVELAPSAAHYRPGARAALHHAERALFEPSGEPADPGAAVALHRAGGERAEVELVAARVLELLQGGVDPSEVAVVFRDPGGAAALVESVFGAYGIPVEPEGLTPLGHTPLGKGLLALLRCAVLGGGGADLLAYLRTPGLLERPEPVDRLEARVRRAGVRDLASVRVLWEERQRPLTELDRLAGATGLVALVDELAAQVARLAAGPHRRLGALLDPAELRDLGAWTAVREAVGEVRVLLLAASLDGLDAARLHDTLAELEVPRAGARPSLRGGVALTSPEGIRARRFDVVFVCGLQEGEFPRRAASEPFLSDEARGEIAAASGLRLPARADRLDRERYLFYVCVSRPERLLVLSSRVSDEEGRPAERSSLVEEIVDLFGPRIEAAAAVRGLGDVTWPVAHAPTEVEWDRALARIGPPGPRPVPDGLRSPEVLAWLAEREAFSAGALETYADCGVKWLVDRLLDPDALEPDPERMVRGRYAHRVLERTFRRLREDTGSRRVTQDNLARAEALLRDALAEHESEFPISPDSTRVRTAVRSLELDLLRFLRSEAASDSPFEPAELELGFGLDASAPALDLGPVKVRGRIDRIDTWGDHAVVRDYKTGRRGHPVARWEPDRRLQAAVYMLAARQNLGLEPAGGLYEPLGAAGRAPRGLWLDELGDALGDDPAANDGRSAAEIEDHLLRAAETVREVVDGIRRGHVAPSPDTCAVGGGCSYPSLCRREAA